MCKLTLLLVSGLVVVVQVPGGVRLTPDLDHAELAVSVDQGRSGSQDGQDEGEGGSLTEHGEERRRVCLRVSLRVRGGAVFAGRKGRRGFSDGRLGERAWM